MSNFVLNEIVTIGDRDRPWINNKIKSLIKNKTKCLKSCVKPNNPVSIRRLFKKRFKFLSKSTIPTL